VKRLDKKVIETLLPTKLPPLVQRALECAAMVRKRQSRRSTRHWPVRVMTAAYAARSAIMAHPPAAGRVRGSSRKT
jgi:hypothetical protein